MTKSSLGALTVGEDASRSEMKYGAYTGVDASSRHLCTRFELRPWATAMRDIDASGLKHLAKTWPLKAALWRRRISCSAFSVVSICRSLVETMLTSHE